VARCQAEGPGQAERCDGKKLSHLNFLLNFVELLRGPVFARAADGRWQNQTVSDPRVLCALISWGGEVGIGGAGAACGRLGRVTITMTAAARTAAAITMRLVCQPGGAPMTTVWGWAGSGGRLFQLGGNLTAG
jgi:hypothetical protein